MKATSPRCFWSTTSQGGSQAAHLALQEYGKLAAQCNRRRSSATPILDLLRGRPEVFVKHQPIATSPYR